MAKIHAQKKKTVLTLYVPGGADLPDLSQIPKFPNFALQTQAEVG